MLIQASTAPATDTKRFSLSPAFEPPPPPDSDEDELPPPPSALDAIGVVIADDDDFPDLEPPPIGHTPRQSKEDSVLFGFNDSTASKQSTPIKDQPGAAEDEEEVDEMSEA